MGSCRLLLIIRLLLSSVIDNVTSFSELECNTLQTLREGTITWHVDFRVDVFACLDTPTFFNSYLTLRHAFNLMSSFALWRSEAFHGDCGYKLI